jgi:hypothetical protein
VSDATQAQERWIMQPSFKIDNKYPFILLLKISNIPISMYKVPLDLTRLPHSTPPLRTSLTRLEIRHVSLPTNINTKSHDTTHERLLVQSNFINHAMTSVPPNTKPIIYPDYCHTLSPTIGKWCPLRATDVHALRDVGMFCDGMRFSPLQISIVFNTFYE